MIRRIVIALLTDGNVLQEGMEERQVSVAGKTYPMEPLFMVLATQNPIGQEGTYPLPGATAKYMVDLVSATRYPDKSGKELGH